MANDGKTPHTEGSWTPTEVELSEFRYSLSRASKRPLRTRLARPLPIVLAGALALAGSSVVAFVVGTSFRSQRQSASLAIGSTVDDASVTAVRAEVAGLANALASKDRAKVSLARDELAGRMQQFSTADLQKIEQSAHGVLSAASRWLSQPTADSSTPGATHQTLPSSTSTSIVISSPPNHSVNVHEVVIPNTGTGSNAVQTLAISPPSNESDDSTQLNRNNSSKGNPLDAKRTDDSSGDGTLHTGNSGSPQIGSGDSSVDDANANATGTRND